MTGDEAETLPAGRDEVLSWEVHLGREHPQRRAIAFAVAFVGGFAGLVIGGHPLLGLFGFLAIFFSTPELHFPCRYKLTDTIAQVRCGASWQEIEWAKVRRAIEGPDGIKLSPFEKRSRLEGFRGVYLRYAGNREEVLAKLRELLGDGRVLLAE